MCGRRLQRTVRAATTSSTQPTAHASRIQYYQGQVDGQRLRLHDEGDDGLSMACTYHCEGFVCWLWDTPLVHLEDINTVLMHSATHHKLSARGKFEMAWVAAQLSVREEAERRVSVHRVCCQEAFIVAVRQRRL